MEFNEEENIEWLMESSKTVEQLVNNEDDVKQRERESVELSRFLHVLRTCFESEPILVESKAKGTLNHEDDIPKLMTRLKALGYFFSIRTSGKYERLSRVMVIKKKIPPASHPYRVLSHVYYVCSQRNKEAEEREPENFIGSSNLFLRCKAMMEIRQIEIFTNVHLPSNRRKRVEMLRNFRRRLLRNPRVEGKIKYEVVISLPRSHNHSCEVKGKQLNDEVKAALHYVLRTGTTSVGGIQKKLYRIVDREFENDFIKPSRDNTAFYPNQKTIYNHLRRDGIELKRIHRENANRLIELKIRTRELLNSLAVKVETCSDLQMALRIYSKIKNADSSLEGECMMDHNILERET